MNADKLLDEILGILRLVREDRDKLQKILTFMEEEIYEEPEEEEIEIPEKYKEIVPKIADSIDAGFVCFLNPDTLEMEEIPKLFMEDQFEEEEEEEEESDETMDSKHYDWQNCITFEPLESSESFKIMEHFTDQLPDEKLQNKLINALNHRRPFANFKFVIDGSSYRQNWFDFKQRWLERHVKELLIISLEKEQENDN